MAYQQGFDESRKAVLAAIIPITSRGMPPGNATEHLDSMKTNLNLPASAKIYFGIDNDDHVYTSKDRRILNQAFNEHEVKVREFAPSRPANIWNMVNQLVKVAYKDACDYFIVLGDDVIITCDKGRNHWFDHVQRGFHKLSTRNSLPFGFGCVALNDMTSPGFPTFPVVHQRHVKSMGIRYCPSIFINQDADCFVFEIYRQWNAASILRQVKLVNTIGGTQKVPRYVPLHVDWKNDVLHSAIARVRYTDYGVPPPTMITMDVVVPSYRVNINALRRILAIKQPMDVATMFFIIIDNPNTQNTHEVQQLEQDFLGRVRVRYQPTNMGASEARNRGIDESAADWILFLDDDVEPNPNILYYYSQAIKSRGLKTCGFVGLTSFPETTSSKISNAAYLSHSLFFWSISKEFPDQPVPWGVTANLLMRRTKVRFRTEFPKTGGGEDIAFCIDSQEECDLPLWSAVEARAIHPWWDMGSFKVAIRFYKWALGDGLLLQIYPHLTYRVMPNVEEMTFFWALLAPLCLYLGFAASLRALAMLVWFWIVDICADVCVLMTANRHVMPNLAGRRRLKAAFESTLVKATIEFGHLWTQVRRLKVLNLCQRFDWFVNLLPHETKKQQQQAFIRFMWFTLPLIVFYCHSQVWVLIVPFVICAILMQSIN